MEVKILTQKGSSQNFAPKNIGAANVAQKYRKFYGVMGQQEKVPVVRLLCAKTSKLWQG